MEHSIITNYVCCFATGPLNEKITYMGGAKGVASSPKSDLIGRRWIRKNFYCIEFKEHTVNQPWVNNHRTVCCLIYCYVSVNSMPRALYLQWPGGKYDTSLRLQLIGLFFCSIKTAIKGHIWLWRVSSNDSWVLMDLFVSIDLFLYNQTKKKFGRNYSKSQDVIHKRCSGCL